MNFMKLHMKLWCLKGKKSDRAAFLLRKSHFGASKYTQNKFFGVPTKLGPLMCAFFRLHDATMLPLSFCDNCMSWKSPVLNFRIF